MAKNHMKKCSSSLTIKEMQIKTTLRFHLTLVRIAIVKNTPTNGVDQDVGKSNPNPLLLRMQASATTLELILLNKKNMGHLLRRECIQDE
jgi:hypothetical protein